MYAISSDNDNQDNNYTKPDSSITVTYHLNNQALKEKEGWRGEEGSWTGILCSVYQSKPIQFSRSYKHGFICVAGVT